MILRCQVKKLSGGDQLFIARQKEDKEKRLIELLDEPVITHLLTLEGRLYDLREAGSIPGVSPYVSCLPCPFCFCEDERHHLPKKHTYPRLGIPEEEVQKLAESPALEHINPKVRYHQAYLTLSKQKQESLSQKERLDFLYRIEDQ